MRINWLRSFHIIKALVLATATLLASEAALAQNTKSTKSTKNTARRTTKKAGKKAATRPKTAAAPQAQSSRSAAGDYVVAVVNSTPVTNREVNVRAQDIARNIAQNGVAVPAREVLLNEALRDIILQKAAIASVRDTTITISEDEFKSSERAMAAQRNVDPQEFKRLVMAERNLSENAYVKELTDQMLLAKMRETRVSMATEGITDVEALRWLRNNGSNVSMTLTENYARHILLPVDSEAAARQAFTKLDAVRKRIAAKKQDFAAAARELSQDPGSAQRGGELGWVGPNVFVPEFEEQVNALQPGQISQPFMSRFGMHLVQLMDRRSSPMTQQQQLQAARGILGQQKVEEAMRKWESEVRAQAYIEMRQAPQ